LRTGNAPLLNAGLVLLSAGLLLSALVARTYSLDPPPQAKACGPPLYSCSRTDLKVTQPDKAPMIDFGGLKGANSVFHDALYNNIEIARCTDALTHPSFPNGSYSVGLGVRATRIHGIRTILMTRSRRPLMTLGYSGPAFPCW
jgi:hypothetical protein